MLAPRITAYIKSLSKIALERGLRIITPTPSPRTKPFAFESKDPRLFEGTLLKDYLSLSLFLPILLEECFSISVLLFVISRIRFHSRKSPFLILKVNQEQYLFTL